MVGGRHTTSGISLESDASRAVHVRMELGVRIVRKVCIHTNTSDLSGRRGDRSRFSLDSNKAWWALHAVSLYI
jgi:hypothetical protein